MKERKKRKKIFLLITIPLAMCAFMGCISSASVMVGLSPEIKDYYTQYISVEVDIFAVSSAEASKIQSGGVDDYFDPNTTARERADLCTMVFTETKTAPRELLYYDYMWKKWKESKADTLVIIADLPPKTKSGADGRIMIYPIESKFLFPRKIRLEITSDGLREIDKKPIDPQNPINIQKPEIKSRVKTDNGRKWL